MFCYQCEQTAKGTGCTMMGVCGKEPTTAALLDLLVHAVKGVAMYAHRAAGLGVRDPQVDRVVLEGLFATVTNVDFDPIRIQKHLDEAAAARDRARAMYEAACVKAGKQPEKLAGPAAWQPAADLNGLLRQGEEVSITRGLTTLGPDVAGLLELTLYGLKGAAAYADHALALGKEDPQIYASFHEALDFLAQQPTNVDDILGWVMKTGELNLRVMGLLDVANTGTYGHPEPTQVRITPVKGKAILVSGHDLKDLEELLKQTEGKGINVYTHGEMLPGPRIPGPEASTSTSWATTAEPGRIQRQRVRRVPRRDPDDHQLPAEAEGLVQGIASSPPALVAWPGVHPRRPQPATSGRSSRRRWPPQGFMETWRGEDDPHRGLRASRGDAAWRGKVIEAVKGGARSGTSSSSAAAMAPSRGGTTSPTSPRQVPKDCVILTLACGKYRFNKLAVRRRSAASRGCWTWGSATTPTRPSRSPWPWPGRSTAG